MPKNETPEAQRPISTSSVEINERGQTMKGGGPGLIRFTVNTDFFKRFIHDRIAMGTGAPFHIPIDASDDYCKQLVAEARRVNASGRVTWFKVFKDNHYLDCEMMNVGCAYSRRVQHYGGPAGAPDDGGGQPEPARRARRPKRKGWSSQW